MQRLCTSFLQKHMFLCFWISLSSIAIMILINTVASRGIFAIQTCRQVLDREAYTLMCDKWTPSFSGHVPLCFYCASWCRDNYMRQKMCTSNYDNHVSRWYTFVFDERYRAIFFLFGEKKNCLSWWDESWICLCPPKSLIHARHPFHLPAVLQRNVSLGIMAP